MNGLLDGARLRARRAVGRARRRLSGNDDGGFVLLESIIAIALITVIMAAIGVEYVSGLAAVARQRATQTAAQLADSTLEQMRALEPSDLVTGRGSSSVSTQFNKGNAIAAISPWLQDIDQASDPGAAATAGANATIPTCDPAPQGATGPASCTQKPGTVAFTVSQFIGDCWLLTSGGDCNTQNQSNSTAVEYLRAVVAVSWNSGTCTAGCYYVTGTLLNDDPDPTFKANQPPPAAPAINDPPNQTTSVGATVGLQLSLVTGTGVPGYSWDLAAGTLPTGLTLSSTGLISGVVGGSAGTNSLTVRLTDGFGRTDTATFTWTVKPAPTIITPGNQTSSVGTTVNLPVTSSCGYAPCTYTITGQPAGLTINNTTGAITGSPTTAATYSSVKVTITDAAGATATTSAFTWTVKAAPTVTTPGSLTSTLSRPVSVGIASTCANTPCTYTITGQPAGLTINNSSGVVSGTPTTAATYSSVKVTITDAAGVTATTSAFTWAIKAGPTVTTPSNQSSTLGTQVSLGIGSSCGNTPCSYTLAGGPAGLGINASTGVISGSPTTLGVSSTVTVTITDAAGAAATTSAFTWTIKAAPSVTTPNNQTSSIGAAVNLAVGSSCANTPCGYTLTGAPAGLSINASTGVITGSPTTAATYGAVQVTITDAAGATATTSAFTWTVKAAPTVTTPNNQTTYVGNAVSLPVASSCANNPCTFALTGAPAGLTINNTTGVISGSPTTPGTSSVTVTITDAAGATATTSAFSWRVYAPPSVTSPGSVGSTVNTALIQPITSTCANSPCTYTLTGAPAGLNINPSTGTISGTPTALGTSSSVTVTVTDNGGTVASTTFSWTVYARPSVTAPGNQTTVNNAAVSLALTKSCPDTPCAYALNGGPAGLSITSAGVVTGTVTSPPQVFSGVTVTVTDSAGATATSSAFSWTVTTPLAGRWTFDESSGAVAADSSTGGHNATLSGSTYARTATAAQGAYAVTLNGSSAAATASNAVLDASTSFTVSAWVKLASTSTTQTFVSQDGTQVSSFALQYRTDTGKFAFSRTSSDSNTPTTAIASSSAAPTTGQWYQLTGVYDDAADTLELYVNGVPQANPASYTTDWNGTGSFVMGRGKASGASTNWVNGAIDDVRVYSSALSDDAVAQLAQAGYWDLDDGAGTNANDGSLNNVDGTLSGGVTWTSSSIVGPSAAQFNGSSGIITSSSSVVDTAQSFSVSAWAKPAGTTGAGTLVSVDGTTNSGFWLQQNGGKWALVRDAADAGSSQATLAVSNANVVAGQWYLVTGVYDSVAKTLSLYVNGVKQGSSVSYTTGWKATGNLIIGRGKFNGGIGDYFNGVIDDVHAFRFALDQSGVNALATIAPPSPATPSATPGATSATVSWTAPTPVAGSPTTGYVVTPYLDGAAQSPITYNSTATTQTLTGLTTGGSYTFTVAATNANGASAPSAQSAAVMPS
ncbi:putative Ig domain-containing protein [uncultured Jatrophihabitans sp.]|uniref:putative Ig domain-containing protein n=1 Tax=uncultured Jatrophihabitans sp. TaxID=1610747 RepID=UPI0035CA6BF2